MSSAASSTRVSQAEAELALARASLAQAIGPSVDAVDARSVASADALDDVGGAPLDTNALVQRAIEQHPKVRMVRARSNASELRISLLKREYVPSPNLSLRYALHRRSGRRRRRRGPRRRLRSDPILDHGQGTIDRGIAEAAEERTRKDDVELTVKREVEAAAGVVAVRTAAWRRVRDQAADIERLRATAELACHEGRASILELLDAYSSYVDANERKLDLQVAAVRAVLDLERAVGPARPQ